MKAVRWLFVIIVLVFFLVLGTFVYHVFVNSKNVPADVQNSPDYTIALRVAERVRFLVFGISALIFPLVAFAMAYYRFPRTSWMRTLLAAGITFLPIFVLFAKQMENAFQQTFPSAPLPLTALQTAGMYDLVGILFTGALFFITERIHVWRVAQ